ncbi:MAG: T9SS C-terminal target domain-containing protein [Saprospiraceae bacterium]|nr:T9SS C-terminal target domain-containing protein [Saprospiraceae bacterium]
MKLNNVFLLFNLCLSTLSFGQSGDFRFDIKEQFIAGFDGVQSFAIGVHEGEWLVVGGRKDGLHRRQPFASFDQAGQNNSVWVINPETGQSWSTSINGLPQGISEQLSSTNLEFWQSDTVLYLIGGYGYAPSEGDHITFPYLTAVDVPGAINAVKNQQLIAPFFRQSAADERLRVTGGYLIKLGNRYFLAGGQKFMGRYNPMGPTHGPGFEQQYTDQIRVFEIVDNGSGVFIDNYSVWSDTLNLHRRDYNAVPQIFPDGRSGFTMFSGVFQHQQDIPWLNSVDVDSSGFVVNNQFNQLLNQYHTAHLPMYDAIGNQMHTVFFGGLGRYYVDPASGLLVDDPNVPFVRTISRVTRNAMNQMEEVKIGEMPALLGTSGEFIPIESGNIYQNGILMLSQITSDSIVIGYILGGISSSAPNIFFTNTGTESSASAKLYRISLIFKQSASDIETPVKAEKTSLKTTPNPTTGDIVIGLHLNETTPVSLALFDQFGRVALQMKSQVLAAGDHQFLINLDFLPKGLYRVALMNNQTLIAATTISKN